MPAVKTSLAVRIGERWPGTLLVGEHVTYSFKGDHWERRFHVSGRWHRAGGNDGDPPKRGLWKVETKDK